MDNNLISIHRKVPYVLFENKHRPYLEVLFLNNSLLKISSKTFALMDTGADFNLVPYSLGKAIGLTEPDPTEFKDAGGVGGNISYIERPCRIYIVDSHNKKMYGFDEIVHWVYPNLETQKRLNALIKDWVENEALGKQTIIGTPLRQHFESQQEQIRSEIKKITDRFEVSSLLGRPFFNNFEFVQFCQKEREEEKRCFFVYKILPAKIVEEKGI